MIASVTGSAQHVGLDRVVVSVGGVGMLVHTPPAVAAACPSGVRAIPAARSENASPVRLSGLS